MNNVNFQEELSAKTTALTLLTNLGFVTLQKLGQLTKFCKDRKKFLWHALGHTRDYTESCRALALFWLAIIQLNTSCLFTGL